MEVFFEPSAVTNLEERAQQALQGGQSEEKSKFSAGSSVGLEHLSDTQKVGGSSPPRSTKQLAN